MISNPMAIHQFPGVLLGLTNTGAAIASLIGTFVTGKLLDVTAGSWTLSLFVPSIILMLISTVVWVSLAGGDEQIDFDKIQAEIDGKTIAATATDFDD